ncbi:transcriptional adapter 1-like [Onthophagus taurus]|uniref:transcriptional adapter 1-like n=1 Tax=Onthophagus taurus TaxID=166361 RepID=UPI000C203D39|nr:transcriptional adapter 1-like [Onthophagus taurus]
MTEINEARKNLESQLGEELMKQYFAILKQWFLFKEPISRLQFDSAVRKLMKTEEQIRSHNLFLLALISKVTSSRVKSTRSMTDKGSFELADYTPLSPVMMPPDFENRSAAAELFLPDSGFISTRISIHAWENGLEGADENVAEYLVQACQVFVKNIITAMITRKEGYKIRDGKFQHTFGVPVPDPFARNSNNIIDSNQSTKIDVVNDDDSFIPIPRNSVEHAEQEAAFSYSCSNKSRSDNKLTVKLLYDTLKDNGNIVGLHSIHSLNLLRIGMYVNDS